ncbi:uncharacterized protein LOC106080064 isoform X1 [Biomphalaria glabrata]|uniref:Protein transport protein sec16 n=1 Tax=Biomphalaria glabrata TaxID=6526 RepID=A0A9U8EPG6_BIOGL|nr:uncharacterized protein LOC106080064 isoform X1 [Biomphalaria glabrata]
MSNHWNNNPSALPNQVGNVKLFDPTQFQPQASNFEGAQETKGTEHYQHSAQTDAYTSWNSWSSWDWNTGSSQQHQSQQAHPVSQYQSMSGDSGGGQYYNSPQYSNVWSPALEGATNYSEQQVFPASSSYSDHGQKQQYEGIEFNQSHYLQQQQVQQPHQQEQQGQQTQQPHQEIQQSHLQVQQPHQQVQQPHQQAQHSHQQVQQPHQQVQQPHQQVQQSYQQVQQSHQQVQQSHQQVQHTQDPNYLHGQFYDQQPTAQEQHTLQNLPVQHNHDQPPHLTYHNQEHQAQSYSFYATQNAWESAAPSGQWEDGFQTQQLAPVGHTEADNGEEGSLNQPDNARVSAEITSYDKPVATAPVIVNSYTNDDDGTVTGSFGNEEDGNVYLDRQARINTDQNHDNEIASNFNKLLSVNPAFHRTSSDISNASLSTLNVSGADDDDAKEALHQVEEVVKRMEGIELSNNENIKELLDQRGNDGLALNQLPRDTGYNPGHMQQTSDYPYFFSAPPPSLPLNTDARPSSPDGDHPSSAESGASGTSGGSSGLTDWEIVPQSAAKASSRNMSPDSTTEFASSQPDGNSNSNRKTGQDYLPRATGKIDAQAYSDSMQTYTNQELPSGPDHAQGDRQPENVPLAPVATSSATMVGPPPGSGLNVNPFRRDGRKSPQQQEQQNVSKPSAILTPSHIPTTSAVLAGNIALDKNSANASSHSPFDSQKGRDISALPSKPKIPTSTEDGNRVSRREYEQSFKPPIDSQPSPLKQHARKSSQESEEVARANEHRRHHSAFHPVNRPRQTTMSPATTLWDTHVAPQPNILLAPAMPLIIPGLSTAPTSNTKSEHTASPDKSRLRDLNVSSESQGRDNVAREERDKSRDSRSRDEKNRSFDSLDEIDAVIDRSRDRSYRSQKDSKDSRDARYSRDAGYSKDSDFSRGDRPLSRSGQYQYERPYSRTDGYGRDDATKYRSSYRDYGDGPYDERYDRPRSRQDESRSSRPSSRATQEADRSRQDYDRDREYYKERSRVGYGSGYGYESYNRNVDYYNEERDRWYRYYKDKEARYTRGYYEEYYGAKHAEYYQQLQQQQQSKLGNTSRQEADRPSSRSQSRGNTPGVSASPGPGTGPSPAPRITPSPGPDYYGRSSRPASRTDYNQDYYRAYGYPGYDPYYEVGYGYDPYSYRYGYPGYEEALNQGYDQGRLTPPKYSYPHTRASFGPNGQLVKVHPNRPADGQPAIVEVQDIQILLESCPEAEEFKHYPGPLTRTNTHKKDVLLFCQQKAASCAENVSLLDRESAQLLWRFLELLIKQNGLVVGTDLSDLLLEGHEPMTHEYSLQGMKVSQTQDGMEEDEDNNSSARDSPAIKVTSDRTVIMTAEVERERWIDRFRHLLLYGRKKDALECAMKNHLWGHALFLASKMDTRTHANVMTRFANSAMRINDPLQTLYQLMSGRQPAAVTCVVDERWGDWRPHLAMILSNQTSRSDIDRKSISTLGDTLASRGFLHASHFCYLMAQVSFGTFNKKTSKLVLIGSSHNLSMEEFATNEAIQCTEVFEYAQMLGNAGFFLPHFQLYKYLYACRLVDYGMSSEALHYLEVISTNIQQYPTMFQPSFVQLVYQLANRLKFSDPQRLQLSEDAEDPIWLQQLNKICSAFADGSLQPISGTATPAGFPGTTTSSESGDYNQQGYGDTSIQQAASAVSGDVYTQQQFYPGQSGNDSYQVIPSASESGTTIQGYSQPVVDPSHLQEGDNAFVHPQLYGQQTFDYTHWQLQQQQQGYSYSGYAEQQQQLQQLPYTEHKPEEQSTVQHQLSTGESYHATHGEVTQRETLQDSARLADSNIIHGGTTGAAGNPISQTVTHNSYGNQQQPTPRASFSASEATEEDEEDDDDESLTNSNTMGFDYFGNVGQQKVVAPPHRYRTLSSSSAGSTARRRRTTSGSSTGSVKAAPYKSTPQQQQQSSGKPLDKQKSSAPQSGNGWFGGLFSKLGRKGKNEMILPDDKNPAIVWDPVKKKWMNADGTEEEESTAPPPPKDLDLLGKAVPSGVPPPSGLSAGNRFSLKSIGSKPQYVDVNNPKPQPVPQNLFNTMPPSANNPAAPPQVFLPGAAPPSNNNNSNMLSVPPGTDELSRSSSVSSLSQEIQQYFSENSTDAPPSAPGPNIMPVLFNPATLKSGTSGVQTAAGPGLKFGQRRAYPK